MAWTDEAREKAAEKRKQAALTKRLARAREVFASDRKRASAKAQHRDVNTNKFTSAGNTDSYHPMTESRSAKLKAKQDRILDYIDARAEAATIKGNAIEKTAPRRNAAGKYAVDNALVTKTLDVFGTAPTAATRRNLTQVAANLAKVGGRVVYSGLKVTEVQAVQALTKLARTMPVTDPRKQSSATGVRKVKTQTGSLSEVKNTWSGSSNPFADMKDSLD